VSDASLSRALDRSLALIRFDADALRQLAEEAESLAGMLRPGSLAHERACSVRNAIRLLVRAAARTEGR